MMASNQLEKWAQQFEPDDPYYEYYMEDGKEKRRKREVPPGLSKHDEKILRKLKKRAHTLDKGFNMCGLRFGWTFIIGLIPIAGDVTDALLSHHLIVKKAQKIEDIPPELIRHMIANNAFSLSVGLIPLVGDICVATFKTNSRNANLVENFLRERGQQNLQNNGGVPPQKHESKSPWKSLFGTFSARHPDSSSQTPYASGSSYTSGAPASASHAQQAPPPPPR